MTDQEFDNLWQEAEASCIAHKLAQEYPVWVHRRKRIMLGTVATLIVGTFIYVAIPLFTPAPHDDYLAVVCNRNTHNEAQWAQLAAEMLITDAI